MYPNKRFITFAELSKTVDRSEEELRNLEAQGRLPIQATRMRGSREFGFHVDDVEFWKLSGFQGLEYRGASMGLENADIFSLVETIHRCVVELGRRNALSRLIGIGRSNDGHRIGNLLSQSHGGISLLYTSANTGTALASRMHGNPARHLTAGSEGWVDAVAREWAWNKALTESSAGLSDIVLDELQMSLAEIGRELRRKDGR